MADREIEGAMKSKKKLTLQKQFLILFEIYIFTL